MYLFGFFVLLIKIMLLAGVYAILSMALFFAIISKIRKHPLKKPRRSKLIFWFLSGFIYTISLFIYAFSYWGDSGMTDVERIPIGNGYAIKDRDGSATRIEEEKRVEGREILIKQFKVRGNHVCAQVDFVDSFVCEDCFIIFDIKKEDVTHFKTEDEYATYALKNSLPQKKAFKGFTDSYNAYWNEWRKWLLP